MIPFTVQSPPAVSQQSLSPQAIQAKGEGLEKAKKWDELADFFESLGPKDRGLFLTFWLRSLQKTQRWERLLEVCNAALPQIEIKSGAKLGLERLLRANALSHLNRHGEALAAHLENGKLGSSASYRSACSEARLVPNWPSEQDSAQALLTLKPGDAEALAWKGEALAQQKEFKDAELALREALKGDPKQPFAWSNLGRCFNERKALPEALEALNKALELDPALYEAHFNRGRTNFEMKQFQASVDDFRIALASSPDNEELQENLRQAERFLKAAHTSARPK